MCSDRLVRIAIVPVRHEGKSRMEQKVKSQADWNKNIDNEMKTRSVKL